MDYKETRKKVEEYCEDVGIPVPSAPDFDDWMESVTIEAHREFGFIPYKENDPALEIEEANFDLNGDSGKYGENEECFYDLRAFYVRSNMKAISFFSESKRVGFFVYVI